MRTILLTLLFLLHCGPDKSPAKSTTTPTDIEAKSELYLSLVKSHQDADGFIMSETCDSLLFTGLLSAAAPELDINIHAAQDRNGTWFRRPGYDCGPEFGNSRSTISRDMILGLFWHMWRNRDLPAAVELMQNLQARNYVLRGDGTPGELALTTTMVQTLAEMIFQLGGPDYVAERNLPGFFSSSQTGFKAHLTVWHILLRGEIYGQISASNFQVLQAQVERQPNNPLFQAAYHRFLDGDYTSVIKLLMDSGEWPADRLPSSLDHCDDWPIQRDYTEKDWGSCIPEVEHSGAELPIIFRLIISAPQVEK